MNVPSFSMSGVRKLQSGIPLNSIFSKAFLSAKYTAPDKSEALAVDLSVITDEVKFSH